MSAVVGLGRDFNVVREQCGTTVRLAARGELDLASAPELRERYAVERRSGAELIVIDLAAVTFMDSTGVHTLLSACELGPKRLRIILGPAAARVIDISGVRSRLPIIEGRAETRSAHSAAEQLSG